MTIRNLTLNDKDAIACISKKYINIDDCRVDYAQSYIFLNDRDEITAYIIIEVVDNENVPLEIFDEETQHFRILDMFYLEDGSFGGRRVDFLRVFWVMLTTKNVLSAYWFEDTEPFPYQYLGLHFEKVIDSSDKYLVYTKGHVYTIY